MGKKIYILFFSETLTNQLHKEFLSNTLDLGNRSSLNRIHELTGDDIYFCFPGFSMYGYGENFKKIDNDCHFTFDRSAYDHIRGEFAKVLKLKNDSRLDNTVVYCTVKYDEEFKLSIDRETIKKKYIYKYENPNLFDEFSTYENDFQFLSENQKYTYKAIESIKCILEYAALTIIKQFLSKNK